MVGYGADLRGDDAAGRLVAERVAERRPGVKVLSLHQLTPEVAADLAEADFAVLVDAALADLHPGVRVLELNADPAAVASGAYNAGPLGHAEDPRKLMALAHEVFGHCARCWWVTIPAVAFELGEPLSPVTEAGVAEAVERVEGLLNEWTRCSISGERPPCERSPAIG